jgi:transposase
MRALERDVQDAIWQTIEPLLPDPPPHPLGCHRPRISNRLCFRGILIRLTTGSSWRDIESILDFAVSDTTLRTRRDEWIEAGVFDQIHTEALAAFDKIIGLDLSEVSIDGSLHKAPYGGEGTGPNPTDRAKLGWKWSVGVELHGVPIGWAIDGANRNDVKLLEPTLDAIAEHGLLVDVDTMHLDRGYDYPKIRRQLNAAGSMISSSRNVASPATQTGRCRCDSSSDGLSKPRTRGCRTTANSAATSSMMPSP